MRFRVFILLVFVICPVVFAQTVIRSADSLIEAAAKGGTYVLAAGTYELTESLILDKDFSLTGFGMTETSIISSAPLVVLKTEAAINLHLEGIHFESNQPSGADVVDIANAHYTIVACRFKGGSYAVIDELFYGSGLYLYGTAHGSVRQSVFEDNQNDAIHMEQDARLELFDSVMTNNEGGLSLFDTTTANVKGLELFDNVVPDVSVLYAEGQSRLFAENVNARDNAGAATFYDDAVVSISSSQFLRNLEGISVNDFVSFSLRDSLIEDGAEGGVWFWGDARGLLERNRFLNNKQFAAVGALGSAKIQLLDSVVMGHEDAAVYIYEQAEASLFSNVFGQNTTGVHASDDAFLELRESQFDENEAAFKASGSARVDLELNSFIDNVDGVSIYGQANARLTKNRFFGGYAETVISVSESASAVINQNEISVQEVKFGAVFLYGEGYASVTQNNIRNNQIGAAVALYDSAKATVQQNILKNNSMGLFIISDGSASLIDNQLDGNSAGVVLQDGSFARLQKNLITNSDSEGVRIRDSSIAWLQDNIITNAGTDGIYLDKTASATILENTLDANGHDGLFARDKARVFVKANSASENDRGGFVATGESFAFFEANLAANHRIAGIGFDLEASGVAQGNTLTRNELGIALAKDTSVRLEGNTFTDNQSSIQREAE